MRNFLRVTMLWILLAFLGEVVLAPLIAIKGISPDFSVIALVLLGLSQGAGPATVAGFAMGLVQDLSNPTLLGLHALCKTCLGFGIGSLRQRLVFGLPIVEGALVTLAALSHDFLFLLVQSRLTDETFLRPLLTQSLPVAIYTGLAGVVILRLADLFGFLRQEE